MIHETECLVHMNTSQQILITILNFWLSATILNAQMNGQSQKTVIQSLHPCQTYPYTAELDENYNVLSGHHCWVLITFRMFLWNLLQKALFCKCSCVHLCLKQKRYKDTHSSPGLLQNTPSLLTL